MTEHVHPGDVCDRCNRRVPHPKKETSPKTQVSAYRVPMDSVETHNETLEAWAEHWGLLSRKHWKFWLLTLAAADALASPPKDLGGSDA